MGHLGKSTCPVHLISAPDLPGRKGQRNVHHYKEKFKAYYSKYYTVATIQSTTSLLKDISMTILLKYSVAEPTEQIFRKKMLRSV